MHKSIRYWNSDLQNMVYVEEAKLVKTKYGASYVYKDTFNNSIWVSLRDAMQQTPYMLMELPVYDRDVILYRGEPCLIFPDTETRTFCVYVEGEKKKLSDVIGEAELIGHAFENRDEVNVAVSKYKEEIYKGKEVATIFTYGYSSGGVSFSAFAINGTYKSKNKFKFKDVHFGFGELYALCAALKDIQENAQNISKIRVVTGNEFLRNMLNSKVLYAWRNNNWHKKNGQKVDHAGYWKYILAWKEKHDMIGDEITPAAHKQMTSYVFETKNKGERSEK